MNACLFVRFCCIKSKSCTKKKNNASKFAGIMWQNITFPGVQILLQASFVLLWSHSPLPWLPLGRPHFHKSHRRWVVGNKKNKRLFFAIWYHGHLHTVHGMALCETVISHSLYFFSSYVSAAFINFLTARCAARGNNQREKEGEKIGKTKKKSRTVGKVQRLTLSNY